MEKARLHLAFLALVALGAALLAAHAQSTLSPIPSESKIGMKTFVILFRQGPRELTDADLARRQAEVSAWARAQNAAGHQLEPRILAPDVQRSGSEAHGDGVGLNAWPITALLFLQASDLAAAAKVGESHPARRYGASVEVRPWAPPAVPATSPVTR